MLMLGLFTRIPAAMLAVVMLVAIKSAKWENVDSLETLLGFEEIPISRHFSGSRSPVPVPFRWTVCCCAPPETRTRRSKPWLRASHVSVTPRKR